MGDTGIQRRRDALVALLKDADPDVRAAASDALGKLELKAGVERVLQDLKQGTMPEKLAAIHALGDIGSDPCMPALAYCASRPEPEIRGAAMDALGRTA